MEHFLIQHKQTGKRYHRIDLEELKQLRSDSIQQEKTPVYMLETDDGRSYYLIDNVAFDRLRRSLEQE